MNDLTQCLIQALQTELETYGGLLHLIEQQQTCVLRHDSASYLHLNELVEAQMATLGRCRVLRQGLSGAVATACGRVAETPIAEVVGCLPASRQPLLRALLEEITRLVERTRQRAGQNQLLLARCLDTARSVLAVFSPGETYSCHGQAKTCHDLPIAAVA